MPWPSMVFLQGKNFVTLEHPWSTIISIVSYLFKNGISVMRSMKNILDWSLFHISVEMVKLGAFHVGNNLRFLTFCAFLDILFDKFM
jgi:pyruvate/oxaloacetate carboxyltransferase